MSQLDRTGFPVIVLIIGAGTLLLIGCAQTSDPPSTLVPSLPPPAIIADQGTASRTAQTPQPTPTHFSTGNGSEKAPQVTVLASPTPVATDTALPEEAVQRADANPWLLAYQSDVEGNDELFLIPADGGVPQNVTQHPAEDRYPAWSPNGRSIAFQTNRDGNWEIYTLHLADKRLTRLTHEPAYDGAPNWSPDGEWILFESYRDSVPCPPSEHVPDTKLCPDLEIYRIPAQGGTAQRLTNSPGGDYQPVWSPDGDAIAFTSWREGHKQVYVMPASGGAAVNIGGSELQTERAPEKGENWSPAWSADGSSLLFLSTRAGVAEIFRYDLNSGGVERLSVNLLPEERPTAWIDGSLLFARYDPGRPFEADNPFGPGAFHLYRLPAQTGAPQPLLYSVQARNPAAAPGSDPSAVAELWLTGKARPNSRISAAAPPQLELRRMDDLIAPDPRLVEGVDEAFRAWRQAVLHHSGYDFLARVSDVFRPAAYYGHRLGYLSWHKTGRAVDLLFDWRDPQGGGALYIVREDIAGEVYWRLFLKCAAQDGSQGEPMTLSPWYFWWHINRENDPAGVAAGGRFLPIPPGYFVDVTALAERYGWWRIPSYHLDDFHWQRDSTATEYWHFQHTGELTWYEAMSQIYPSDRLKELFSRQVAAAHGQTEEVMDGKGLPPGALP